MNARGFSLIELLFGSAIAGLVGSMALAVLWRTGLVTARAHARMRGDDDAWLALAAISRDLRSAATWQGCVDHGCAKGTAHRVANAIVAGQVQWFADGGLWRCEWKDDRAHWACAKFLESISSVRFTADMGSSDGKRERREFAEKDGVNAQAIDVTIWTAGGRPFSRTTGWHERAH